MAAGRRATAQRAKGSSVRWNGWPFGPTVGSLVRPPYQGVALAWENRRAFGPLCPHYGARIRHVVGEAHPTVAAAADCSGKPPGAPAG